ncbi:MobH family relaxase [Pseudoalteromonas sp. MQS005]|uniref:MobH family relaxase n=1 Tax=Pseudoalteromonas sp. MQS005 TaxID=1854052 RepID=UPI0007E50499|nr:MobH family relaxase [Pseudoalteromonas sp. MQS005]
MKIPNLFIKVLALPFKYLYRLYRVNRSESYFKQVRNQKNNKHINYVSDNTHTFTIRTLENNKELISQTERSFGHCHEWAGEGSTFENLFIEVIINYSRYCANLPASEGYHHAVEFGLIDHSLQVASLSLRQAKSQFLPTEFPLDIERKRIKRYQYAAWLCGLLHDAGKLQTDMTIFNRLNPNEEWIPITGDLIGWIEQNNIKSYGIRWRTDRILKGHEIAPIHLFQQVLTPAAKRYIGGCPGNLVEEITLSLSNYKSNDCYLAKAVRAADVVSTAKDIQTTWDKNLGVRKAALHEKIIRAMQANAKFWLENGKAVAIDNEIYLRWPDCFNELTDILSSADKTIPNNPTALRDNMAQRGIIRKYNETEYTLFFEGVVNFDNAMDLLTKKTTSGGVGLVRLEWPFFLTKTAPIPTNKFGLLKIDLDCNAVLFTEKDSRYITSNEVKTAAEKHIAISKQDKEEADNNVETKTIASAKPEPKVKLEGKAKVKTKPELKVKDEGDAKTKTEGNIKTEGKVKPAENSEHNNKNNNSPTKDAKSKRQPLKKPVNANTDLFSQKINHQHHQQNEARNTDKPADNEKAKVTTQSERIIKILNLLERQEVYSIDGQKYIEANTDWKSAVKESEEGELIKLGHIKLNNPASPFTRYYQKKGKSLIMLVEVLNECTIEKQEDAKGSSKKHLQHTENKQPGDIESPKNTEKKQKTIKNLQMDKQELSDNPNTHNSLVDFLYSKGLSLEVSKRLAELVRIEKGGSAYIVPDEAFSYILSLDESEITCITKMLDASGKFTLLRTN